MAAPAAAGAAPPPASRLTPASAPATASAPLCVRKLQLLLLLPRVFLDNNQNTERQQLCLDSKGAWRGCAKLGGKLWQYCYWSPVVRTRIARRRLILIAFNLMKILIEKRFGCQKLCCW